jgi:hypothetical protein
MTSAPDTFNILAISSADSTPTAGSVLYVDDLYLDYTLGIEEEDASRGIDIYQDRETRQILVYFDFIRPETTTLRLYNIIGQTVAGVPSEPVMKGRRIIGYTGFPNGIYLLEILHDGKKFCRKFLLNN